MAGLPTVQVQFDDGTGTFSYDVTSFALLSDGFSISRGRGDTQSAPTAGQLTLTLNNADGRFTPGSTILGTPSPIKVDQRIRVRETVNGVTYTRFTGYVKSWVLGWLAVAESTAVVKITATDAQARAERRVLRAAFEEEALANSVGQLYLLNEPAGATISADTSGNQSAALTQAGTGTAVTYSGAEATFAGGKYLDVSTLGPAAPLTLLFKFKTSATSQGFFRLGALNVDITGGNFAVYSFSASQVLIPFTPDGAYHVFAIKLASSSSLTLYLDGSIIAGPGPFSPSWTSGSLSLGTSSSGNLLSTFTGTMSMVGLFPSALADATVASISSIMLNGLPVETDVARITRLAGYAGISMGTTDATLTSVPTVDITDQTAWQAIQDVCDATMGVAYINGSGTLDFHNRQRVTVKSAPDITLSGVVTADAEPTTDDQDLLNYLEVSASATGITQVIRNLTSETAHGRYSDSKSYLVITDVEASDRGNWLVSTRAEPASSGRYGTLNINLYGMSTAFQSATVAAMEHGTWLRVVAMPSQTTGGTTVDVVVEGITENQSGDGWIISCNVVPKKTLYPKIITLDTSVLDGTDLLGV